MTTVPKILHEHINTAFPANVCLLGSVLPNGFAQITPRGGTMVYDDEHIGLWERGSGSSAAGPKTSSALTNSSTSPVGRSGLAVPSGRARTRPSSRTTHSERSFSTSRKTGAV